MDFMSEEHVREIVGAAFLDAGEQLRTSEARKVLADLASEGGATGIHLLAGVDTWNNVSRWLPRKVMAEFEMRMLFQMSANDSANLIDSPAAGNLGLHRALLYNAALGTVETFRPYAEPESAWWQECGELLKPKALEV